MSLILPPSAEQTALPKPYPLVNDDETVALDLEYSKQVWDMGDVLIFLTWNFAADGDNAVLILAQKMGRKDEEPGLCVIERGEAWKWSRTHNDDDVMLGEDDGVSGDQWQADQAAVYAAMMHLDTDPGTVRRIRGMIEDRLEDLLMLPPAPNREEAQSAIFTTTSLSTGSVTEHEVTLN